MKIGALIVTTGLPRVSGVTALLSPVGSISAGQRMISAFQCADVSLVGLVVGPEDKKTERQLAQNSVIFLRCPEGTGTVLTEKGKRLMDAYDQFAAQMKKEADHLYSGFFSDSMNLP